MGIVTEILKGLPLSAVLEDKLKNLEKKYETIDKENEQLRDALEAMGEENAELKKQLAARSISQDIRADYSEDDLLGILESWFRSLPQDRRFAAIEYSNVDAELELPAGTAYRLLKKSVAELALDGRPIQVKREGSSIILFTLGKHPPRRATIRTF